MTGLPAIADAQLPREVRTGSEADKRAYKAALGFEQVLLGELVSEMTKSTPSLSEGQAPDAAGQSAPPLHRTLDLKA